jgi:hypothetical protein
MRLSRRHDWLLVNPADPWRQGAACAAVPAAALIALLLAIDRHGFISGLRTA